MAVLGIGLVTSDLFEGKFIYTKWNIKKLSKMFCIVPMSNDSYSVAHVNIELDGICIFF